MQSALDLPDDIVRSPGDGDVADSDEDTTGAEEHIQTEATALPSIEDDLTELVVPTGLQNADQD